MNRVNKHFGPICDAICPPAVSTTGKIEISEDMAASMMRYLNRIDELEETGNALLDELDREPVLTCNHPRRCNVIEAFRKVLRG